MGFWHEVTQHIFVLVPTVLCLVWDDKERGWGGGPNCNLLKVDVSGELNNTTTWHGMNFVLFVDMLTKSRLEHPLLYPNSILHLVMKRSR